MHDQKRAILANIKDVAKNDRYFSRSILDAIAPLCSGSGAYDKSWSFAEVQEIYDSVLGDDFYQFRNTKYERVYGIQTNALYGIRLNTVFRHRSVDGRYHVSVRGSRRRKFW